MSTLNRTLHALRALMSLTDEDTLEIGYVIKELRVPSPRALRDMTEAISRHQADLVYNYLCIKCRSWSGS